LNKAPDVDSDADDNNKNDDDLKDPLDAIPPAEPGEPTVDEETGELPL
jgi:hypothetical protein